MGPLSNGSWLSADATGYNFVQSGSNQSWGTLTDREGNQLSQPSGILKDTNGNQITPNVNSQGQTTSWNDTIGRVLPAPWTTSSTSDFTGCTGSQATVSAYTWTAPGPNGGSSTFKFCTANFTISYNPPDCIDDGAHSYCTGGGGRGPLTQSVVLPNGTAWTFEYDNFGELSSVTLPTGGTISYTWDYTSGLCVGPEYIDPGTGVNTWLYPYGRRATSRTVDAKDGTGAHTWTYLIPGTIDGGPVFQTIVTDPATPANDSVHVETPLANTCSIYETELDEYSGSHTSGTLLRKVATNYQWGSNNRFGNVVINVVPNTITTTDVLSGQVSRVTKTYDSGGILYGNLLTEKDYDWGNGAPGALLRTTATQYQAFQNGNYLNANLLALPSQTSIFAPGFTGDPNAGSCGTNGAVACTTYGYDENNGSPQGVHGNQTSITRWLNGGASPQSKTIYNTQGMPTTETDPKNNPTILSYDSTGTFVSEIQHPATSGVAHNEFFAHDLNTGEMTSHTDQNGKQTQYQYDSMGRLRTVTYPASDSSGSGGGTETYNYNDVPGIANVEIQRTMDGSRYSVEYVLFDGLGREISHSKANDETASGSAPWDKTDTCYEARGLKSFASYPYQATSYNAAQVCSGTGDTYIYDELRRIKTLTHSDGSSVTTTYAGPAARVADEGNGTQSVQRISQVDGLGRLVSICEVSGSLTVGPSNGPCQPAFATLNGYLTQYVYDPMGNLTNVTQGGVNRSFNYDSLSRLLTSSNPETGIICYGAWSAGYNSSCNIGTGYDANGNLTERSMLAPNQAATGTVIVTTTYSYDALNRLLSKTYSDGSTLGAYFNYDETSANGISSLTNTLGRLSSEGTGSSSNGTTSSEFSYDPMGRVALNGQKVSTQYNLNYAYDLAGDVLSSTNGLGTTLSYVYNRAQRLTSLSSSLNDGTHPPTLFSLPAYNAFGSLLTAKLGNGVQELYSYYPRGWLHTIGGPNIPGTGGIPISGNEQTLPQNTTASGSVQITGSEFKRYTCPKLNVCWWVYDTGKVTITVNGTSYQYSYGQNDTNLTVASALTNLLNAGSLVDASYDSTGKITITPEQSGPCCNYSLSATSATTNTSYFTGTSFPATASGASLTGGGITYIYDSGTVSATVQKSAGTTTTETVNYGQGDTPSLVAQGLAAKFNGDPTSLVTASAPGATLNLTSIASGSGTNYSWTCSSSTTQTQYFTGASFTCPPSGALTGGADGSTTTPYSLSLSYYPDGDVQLANDRVNGNWTYGYDAMNQLISSNQSGGQSITYDYDRYGNRWHENPGAQYSFSWNNNRIDSGSGIVYDAAGNVTNDGLGHTFTYDGENRIISVNGGSTAYIYDASGNRVRKTTSSGTVDYLSDLGGRVLTELTNGSWTRGEVFSGGRHLATYSGGTTGTTYFIHADWLGTERVRSNISGQSCESIASLPFGDGQTVTYSNGCNADSSPLHFTGKQRDTETNLDDFGARYYSSTAGRWMSPDWSAQAEPLPYAKLDNPQSLNLYSYVLNNPLSFVDTNGHGGTCGGKDGSSCRVTVTQITQNVSFYDKNGNVTSTVEVTTDLTTISNSKTGAVVSAGATATAENVSGHAFSSSQLSTIGSTVAGVQQAGASMALGANPAQLMTAITAKESTLGIAAPVNPLQLSCSSGTCASGDRGTNIQGALNVLQNLGRRSNYDPASTYSRYNGVPDPIQRATNVRNFMNIYNGMTQSSWGWSPSMPAAPLPPGLQ